MQLRTMILVACLTTVPAVAADGPVPGCEQTEEGLRCGGELPPSDPVNGDPDAQTAEACKPLIYDILVTILPDVDWELHPECIIRP